MGWSLRRALMPLLAVAFFLRAQDAGAGREKDYQIGSAGTPQGLQGSPDAPAIGVPEGSAASGRLKELYHSAHTAPAMRSLIDEVLRQRERLQRQAGEGIAYQRPPGFANLGAPAPSEGRRQAQRPEPRVADLSLSSPVPVASGRPLAPSGGAPAPARPAPLPESAWSGLREGGRPDYVLLAKLHLKAGRPAQALSHAEQALSLQPRSADAHMLRALALEALGRRREALQATRTAARLDPDRFEPSWRRGREGLPLLADGEDGWRLFEPVTPRAAAQGLPADARRWFLLGLLLALASGAVALRNSGASIPPILKARRRAGPRVTALGAAAAAPPQGASPRPASRPALADGEVLAGKYRISRGAPHGEREAWKAVDRVLDRPALVKRIGAPGDRSRVAAAKTAANLHHPNVGDIYEVLDVPQGLFVVYEHVPGKSLRAILSHAGRLPPGQIRDILVPVCRALEHAHHRGIAHGLLTPERVWVTRQGYVKVLDFVLAGGAEGTAGPYAAPEARRGRPTPLSDIFSLGLCCYEMLCGCLPGGGEEPEGPLVELLERTLDLDARTRLASAGEFARLLREGAENPATTSA